MNLRLNNRKIGVLLATVKMVCWRVHLAGINDAVYFVRLNDFSRHITDLGVQKRSSLLSGSLQDVEDSPAIQAGESFTGPDARGFA